MELFITLTKGMGEPTYGLLLSLSVSCIEGSSLYTRWILGAVVRRLSRGKYIILSESRGQRALNGSVLLLVMVS